MKRLFIIGLVALFAVACQQEVDSPSVAESGSRAVEPLVMEQFVADLISGRTFGVSAVEITLDGEVIKAFDEIMYGTIGAKYYDYGCNTPYLFYEDGTCRMGYITSIYNVCGKPGHGNLYDTLTWSYNIEEATITLKAEDLPFRPYGETFKVVEYKDNKVLIEGPMPMRYGRPGCTFRYKGWVANTTKTKQDFEEKYLDEDDFPCCRQ